MRINRDNLSEREIRRYAVLQAGCWLLALAALGTFMLNIPLWAKWVAVTAMVSFLMGAVVFNFGRRFGIRVLWSQRFRR